MNLLIQLHDLISPLYDRYAKYSFYIMAVICGACAVPSIIDFTLALIQGAVNTVNLD